MKTTEEALKLEIEKVSAAFSQAKLINQRQALVSLFIKGISDRGIPVSYARGRMPLDEAQIPLLIVELEQKFKTDQLLSNE